MITVSLCTYLVVNKEYLYSALSFLTILVILRTLYAHYKKFNQNILFLLNALDNGDYSFHFAEAKLSSREKELNQMLNRIKDILTKARKEVIENEKFLSLIVESISTGIIILDEHNNIQTTNKATTELLGLNVFTHLNQLKAIDDSFPQLFKDLHPNTIQQIKIANEREEYQISLHTSIIRLKKGTMKIITLNNIGNELEAKEMESWIRLIRVMTHEIMNSIAPISSLSETLLFTYKNSKDDIPDNSISRNTIEAFETIRSTAKGLLSFVESYRKFTGIPKPEMSEINLIPLIEKIIHLESHNLEEKNINIQLFAENKHYSLTADESQISQILINLIKNAKEAVSQNDKIEIRISEKETKIQIDVCNNGLPILADVAAHIFIPFFTTKDTGTGIGLSVSRYMMRLHGGNLKHHTLDGWTIFSMVF
ncbi:MAG: ATP-binding protein [Dysgonomonas sp.]|nr:ATP-binding protein [Dysgonomonas sp.]